MNQFDAESRAGKQNPDGRSGEAGKASRRKRHLTEQQVAIPTLGQGHGCALGRGTVCARSDHER
jgi:hypothetical protein